MGHICLYCGVARCLTPCLAICLCSLLFHLVSRLPLSGNSVLRLVQSSCAPTTTTVGKQAPPASHSAAHVGSWQPITQNPRVTNEISSQACEAKGWTEEAHLGGAENQQYFRPIFGTAKSSCFVVCLTTGVDILVTRGGGSLGSKGCAGNIAGHLIGHRTLVRARRTREGINPTNPNLQRNLSNPVDTRTNTHDEAIPHRASKCPRHCSASIARQKSESSYLVR